MADYIITSVPSELGDGRLAYWVVLRDTPVDTVAYRRVEVIAPPGTVDPGQYVADNFADLWSDESAEVVTINAWINAQKAPLVKYYLNILVAGYSTLMAGESISVATGAAVLEIQKNAGGEAEYQKVRDAMLAATDDDVRRFLAAAVFAISGVMAGLPRS